MQLQFVPTAEGYYDFVHNKYFYQYKDQIGNVRLTYYKDDAGNAAIDRATDYYPFGLEFGGGGLNTTTTLSPKYFYTFQGQEKQEETGWNSFKWRNYDPSTGRFFNIDPLAEDYAYQSPYNFSENAVVNARELEGLEKVLIFGSRAAAAGAAAPVSPRTGVYTELKRHTQNSLRFWAGAADTNYNIIRASSMVGIALANRVLNSEGESKESDSKVSNNEEKKKTTLEKNRSKGKQTESEVTEELKNEFPEDEVLTQVTGKFKDGKTTVFDNVIVNKETGKVKETNETKSGNARLSKPQTRYRKGESVELTGKNAGTAKGQTINPNTIPDRVTRR